jgi:tetratricopeptide (TPR) repeat protein
MKCLVFLLLIQSHLVLADGNIQPGIELFAQADYQQAYEYFDDIESHAEYKDNAEFLYYYGLSLYKTDRAKEALEVMKRAAELDPENPDYQYALTQIYLLRIGEVSVFRKVGMFGKLTKSMVTAADREPTYLRGYEFYTGWLLYAPGMAGGDVEKGMVYLEKLKLVSEPDWTLMEAGLASRDEEYDRAEELYLKALEMKRSPSSVFSIAQYYLERKKYQQAISYANAFNLMPKHWADPGNSDGHLVLAQAYHYLGDEAAFEEHSKKAIGMTNNEAQKERFEASLDALSD